MKKFLKITYIALNCRSRYDNQDWGEYRLSNFLLWQSAYAEIYISDKNWPEFNEKELEKALEEYEKRNRTFGKV